MKIFNEIEMHAFINKAFKEGQINIVRHFLNYIENELKEKNEWFEQLNENGEYMNERWIECNSAIQTLNKIENEFHEALKIVENPTHQD